MGLNGFLFRQPAGILRRYAGRARWRLAASRFQTLNRIELDGESMLSNVALVRERNPGLDVIPVVKGNAYGHGIAQVATILSQAGCRLLAVDGYFEAERIHGVSDQRVLVMGHILPANVRLLDTRHCSFVVQDVEGLRAFGSLNRPVRVHLELNTGTNRLGLSPEELPAYLRTIREHPSLELEGVMTHLADADSPLDQSFTERQERSFDEQVEGIRGAGLQPRLIHIAHTAGSVKVRSRHANAVRPGLGIYGINPLSSNDPRHRDLAGLRPVLELRSTIIKVLELGEGDSVSYSRTFVAPGPMRVGVLAIGYYEGVPRELSNRGCAIHGCTRLPFLGRVCMNHVMVDLAGTGLAVGDEVVVISRDPLQPNSIAALQAEHGLFPYSILTGLAVALRRKVVRPTSGRQE